MGAPPTSHLRLLEFALGSPLPSAPSRRPGALGGQVREVEWVTDVQRAIWPSLGAGRVRVGHQIPSPCHLMSSSSEKNA